MLDDLDAAGDDEAELVVGSVEAHKEVEEQDGEHDSSSVVELFEYKRLVVPSQIKGDEVKKVEARGDGKAIPSNFVFFVRMH